MIKSNHKAEYSVVARSIGFYAGQALIYSNEMKREERRQDPDSLIVGHYRVGMKIHETLASLREMLD